MEISDALITFTALSQETRLNAFRILVEHGKQGISSGDLSKKLRIPQNTLSFHVTLLRYAKLVTSRKESRSVIYYANIETLQNLVGFLVENCCAVDKADCAGIVEMLEKTKRLSGARTPKEKCC